jgi:hypothetical protein
MKGESSERDQHHVSASVTFTTDSEQIINTWLQTGQFPYPELQVFPTLQPQAYSRSDIQLIIHISSIARYLFLNDTSEMTVWSPRVPECVWRKRSSSRILFTDLYQVPEHILLVSICHARILGIFR